MWNCLRIPKFSVFFFLFSTLRIFFLVSISLFLSPPLQIFQFSALLSTAGPDIYSSSFFFFRPRQLLRYSWDHPFHSPSPPVCVCVCVCVCVGKVIATKHAWNGSSRVKPPSRSLFTAAYFAEAAAVAIYLHTALIPLLLF